MLVSTGSGSDPHLLALLRAMRLRSAAPDAAAAGEADATAALTSQAAPTEDRESAEAVHPEELLHPDWPTAHPKTELPAEQHTLPPVELPPVHPSHELQERGVPRPGLERTAAEAAGDLRAGLGSVPSSPRPVPPTTPSPSTSPDTAGASSGSDVSGAATSGASSPATPSTGASSPAAPSSGASGPTPSAGSSPSAGVTIPGYILPSLVETESGSVSGGAPPAPTSEPIVDGPARPATPAAPAGRTPAGSPAPPTDIAPGHLMDLLPQYLARQTPAAPAPGNTPQTPPTPTNPPAALPPGPTAPGAPPLTGTTPPKTPVAGTPGSGAPTAPTPGSLSIPATPITPRPPQGSPIPGTPVPLPGAATPALPPVPGAPVQLPGAATPALPPVPGAPVQLPGAAAPALPPVPGAPVQLPGAATPALPPARPASPSTPALPAFPGAPAIPPGTRTDVPANRPTIPYPPGAGPWPGGLPVSSTQPIEAIPRVGGPRPTGPPWPGDPIQSLAPPPPLRPPMPVPPARTLAPVDGMNPADDAMMHEVQRLLSNSLSLAGGPPEVAARLRAALVQAEPALFRGIPGDVASQTDQLADGLTWLVHNFDQPPALVAGFGRLGAALAECGIAPQQLQLAGAALAEAMRAGMAANGWRQDFDQAWRSTWQHAYEWIAHGMATARYQPTTWTAVVERHDRRRDDLAVVRLRPYLPMPYRPGQYARIEVPELPGLWRPYSLAGAPRRDNIVELHVRAKSVSGVSGTLVHRLGVGDKVRIARAEGGMCLPESGRDLLMIAGDTGVAPLKALLTELAATADPRSVVLFWGARTLSELYDIDEIAAIAGSARRATVVPVISEGPAGPYASGLVTDAVAAYGEWSEHEVYLAGPPLMLAATAAALYQLGVAPERIHHDAPE